LRPKLPSWWLVPPDWSQGNPKKTELSLLGNNRLRLPSGGANQSPGGSCTAGIKSLGKIIRKQVRWISEEKPSFSVFGEAYDGVEAVEEAQRLKPDVVVL
jgi:hypothetical protein